jgi:phospholipid/cholesterol/gamma-HCH transport system substrate-binding protein
MSKSRLEWKVGLFVFIGLALLAALLVEFSKGLTFFRPTYDIYLRSGNLGGGLKIRAGVLMSGVQIGTVTDIRLAPSGTNVTMTLRIFSEYAIHKDARFTIETSGFLGDQYVSVVPTKNADGVFENGGVAEAEAPFNLQEMARSAMGFIARVNETVTNLDAALSDVRRMLLSPETLTNLSVAAANLRQMSDRAVVTLDDINSFVATNSPVLTASSTNLMAFAERMKEFGGTLNDVVATNRPAIDAAVKNIESSTEVLNSLVRDVQDGKGFAGELLKNERLSADLSLIAKNLSITTSNLNRLGLWGILWQHKPPRTNAPGPRVIESPKSKGE